jgi:hypothetical protein
LYFCTGGINKDPFCQFKNISTLEGVNYFLLQSFIVVFLLALKLLAGFSSIAQVFKLLKTLTLNY